MAVEINVFNSLQRQLRNGLSWPQGGEMYCKTHSAVHAGLETMPVSIEASYTSGLAGIQMLGNGSELCRDGKERARAALDYLGWKLPPQRINLSFTPADLKKDGNHYDLAFAVVLNALVHEQRSKVDLDKCLFAAELGLKGNLLPVQKILSVALEAIRHSFKYLIISKSNLKDLACIGHMFFREQAPNIICFETLREVLQWIETESREETTQDILLSQATTKVRRLNFDDMRLSASLKRLALVCVHGRHSLLLRGSPGTGKTMFATRIPCLLPPLEGGRHVEALRHHSFNHSRLSDSLLAGQPPVRSPHHSASAGALTGNSEFPGEIALAHRGLLFLDEINEFRRDILESLREPLESGRIEVARARLKTSWQAEFLLLAACNNCPCGWLGSSTRKCHCPQNKIKNYHLRLSGPLLQRFDVHAIMPEAGVNTDCFEPSEQMGQSDKLLADLKVAFEFAKSRQSDLGIEFNSEIPAAKMGRALGLSPLEIADFLNRLDPKPATTRSALRLLRVARSLADLENSSTVQFQHIEEASAWLPEAVESYLGVRSSL